MRTWPLLLLLWLAAPAYACGPDWIDRVELDDGLTLVYRTQPSPIELTQPFVLHLRFCRDDKIVEVDNLKLDATMPAHGHGMNYEPSIKKRSEGEYETIGMLFHMPGAWRVEFTYEFDGSRRQARFNIDL